MLEESASAIPSSSIWTSMNSWFTPTVLFVFLNIMIGTIVYTSSLANNQKQQQTQENDDNHSQQQNDINPQQQQQPTIVRSPSVFQRLKSVNLYRSPKSDTVPASGEILTKLPAKMRKSASMKSAFGHFEEGDIVEARRPATVRETGSAKVTDGDEEMDAKADDFINKFKQQLKLQRLDSIIMFPKYPASP